MEKFLDRLMAIIVAITVLGGFAIICATKAHAQEPVKKYYWMTTFEEGDKGKTTLLSFESEDGEECLNIEVQKPKSYIKEGDKLQGWVLEVSTYKDGSKKRAIYNPDTTDCIFKD